jgi:hypothetical protein
VDAVAARSHDLARLAGFYTGAQVLRLRVEAPAVGHHQRPAALLGGRDDLLGLGGVGGHRLLH